MVGAVCAPFSLLVEGSALLDNRRRPRFVATRSGRWKRPTCGEEAAHAAPLLRLRFLRAGTSRKERWRGLVAAAPRQRVEPGRRLRQICLWVVGEWRMNWLASGTYESNMTHNSDG